MMKRFLYILIAVLGLNESLMAGPIGYADSWAVMGFNQSDMIDWQASYSFTHKFGLGVDYGWDKMEGVNRQFIVPRFNYLVYRSNGPNHQANIYASGGAGVGLKDGLTRATLMGTVESDYETRSIYFAGKASITAAKEFQSLIYYQLRAGVAPYVADFESLHSWVFIQAQYFPNSFDDKFRIGPFLRLFYRNVLWELGVTNHGMANFNFMIHF